jgi:hypothetical protein
METHPIYPAGIPIPALGLSGEPWDPAGIGAALGHIGNWHEVNFVRLGAVDPEVVCVGSVRDEPAARYCLAVRKNTAPRFFSSCPVLHWTRFMRPWSSNARSYRHPLPNGRRIWYPASESAARTLPSVLLPINIGFRTPLIIEIRRKNFQHLTRPCYPDSATPGIRLRPRVSVP